jgi:hypothetical protein
VFTAQGCATHACPNPRYASGLCKRCYAEGRAYHRNCRSQFTRGIWDAWWAARDVHDKQTAHLAAGIADFRAKLNGLTPADTLQLLQNGHTPLKNAS